MLCHVLTLMWTSLKPLLWLCIIIIQFLSTWMLVTASSIPHFTLSVQYNGWLQQLCLIDNIDTMAYHEVNHVTWRSSGIAVKQYIVFLLIIWSCCTGILDSVWSKYELFSCVAWLHNWIISNGLPPMYSWTCSQLGFLWYNFECGINETSNIWALIEFSRKISWCVWLYTYDFDWTSRQTTIIISCLQMI